MTLYDICESISDVVNGLACGVFEFSEEGSSDTKSGSPSDILADILAIIGDDVFYGKTPEREKIEDVYQKLKSFQDRFNVNALRNAVDSLEKYLYARIIIKFPIYINEGRESFIEYAVTEKMYQKIMKARDSGYSIRRAYGLDELYDELMIAANKKLNHDANFEFIDIDYVDFDFYIDYPKSTED